MAEPPQGMIGAARPRTSDAPTHDDHEAGVPRLAFGDLLMGAVHKAVRKTAALLAACAFVMSAFPGHYAKAKGNSLKDQLKHALVGQVVTTRILLGNRARPDSVAQEGLNIDFPVHTLIDADTGEIAYRVEDPFMLEWATVHPSEMVRSFDAGTSFRISSIHLKGNRLEIKLKRFDGKSAEVKLMMGKGWKSRYDAAAVEASLGRFFAFGEPGRQHTETQQALPQAEHDAPPASGTLSAAPGAPAQVKPQYTGGTAHASAPVDSAAGSEQPGTPTQPVMGAAYVDCGMFNYEVALLPSPEVSSPIAELHCGEKVTAIDEQNGWVKVRTGQGMEGYVSHWFLAYGQSPFPTRPAGEQTAVPEGQPDSPAATPVPDGNAAQGPPAAASTLGADGDAMQSPPAQKAKQPPSAYAASARQGGSAAGSLSSSGYWLLLTAACIGLLLVGLSLRRARRNEERQHLYEEQRKAERRKEKRKERRMGNQSGEAPTSAKRSYRNVAARFADLAKTCGPQIAEMARATMAVNGADFSGKGPADFLFFDAIRILSTVSKTKEEVPARLAVMCRLMYRSLNPRSFPPWEIDTILYKARSQSFEVDLPFTVTMLAGYDEMQGTHRAQRAADAFWALVCAACEIMDMKRGVATKIVHDRYLEFFRPYMSADGEDRAGSEGPSRPAADNGMGGLGECVQCTKSYEALDITPNATRDEIKTAYRDLVKIFHSDRFQGSEERVRQKAEERLKDINLAYGHISSHWKSQED